MLPGPALILHLKYVKKVYINFNLFIFVTKKVIKFQVKKTLEGFLRRVGPQEPCQGQSFKKVIVNVIT